MYEVPILIIYNNNRYLALRFVSQGEIFIILLLLVLLLLQKKHRCHGD